MKSSNTRHLHETGMQSHSADQASVDSQAAVVDERFTHLSTFALSGSDGNVRWHHVAGDFEKSHAKVLNSAVAVASEICLAVVDFYVLLWFSA